MENDKLLIKLAAELNELIVKEKNRLPYSINLIDELHINENAHSRILNVLLQYCNDGHHPIYESFIEHIFNTSISKVQTLKIQSPIFSCEEARIDLLVKEVGKYAIIIENKVRGAVDQDSQIERYIKKVHNMGFDSKHIYVMYLTKDGTKEVSESSLTPFAQKELDYSTENSRFITINYKEDILPWLEEIVLPSCKLKETLLISAITQYIDFLKGYLNLKPQQIVTQNIMNTTVKETLNLETLAQTLQINNNVSILQESIDSIIQEHVDIIAQEKIINPLESFLKEKYPELKIINSSFNNYNTFQIYIEPTTWKKCRIRFSLEGSGFLYGIWQIDPDKNPITDEENENLNMLREEKGYKSCKWWPCESRFNAFAPDGKEYWTKVESGNIEILKEITKVIEEIYPYVKDFTL